MCRLRFARLLAAGSLVWLTACGKSGASSSTAPSSTPAAATINESFSATIPVNGGVFYSFAMPQYGNVAVTLTGLTGTDVPDGVTLNVGIGQPAGTSCSVSTTIATGPGDTAQVTGTYGPGIFCVSVHDSGTLTSPVNVTAAVAHS